MFLCKFSGGFDSGGRDVDFWCATNHVVISAHGQYAYSGHVINLPPDVASFANSLLQLPSELDVIVVR